MASSIQEKRKNHNPQTDWSPYAVETVRELYTRDEWIAALLEAGIPSACLTRVEVACPKCGGTGRCCLAYPESGGMRCNNCFPNKNGDGIAALRHFLGWTFHQALNFLGDRKGLLEDTMRGPKKSRSTTINQFTPTPEHDEHYRELFANSKPGIIPEAIKRAGGIAGKYTYRKEAFDVLAFPVWGHELAGAKPVGHVVTRVDGKKLPTSGKDISYKTIGGKGAATGIVAPPFQSIAEVRATTKVIAKAEGVSCFLALLSTAIQGGFDESLFPYANAAGAMQKPMPFIKQLVKGKQSIVFADIDEVGRKGGRLWATEIAGHASRSVLVVPSLPLDGSKGKDLRDCLSNAENSGHALRELIKNGEVIEAEKKPLPLVDITSNRPTEDRIEDIAKVLASPESTMFCREGNVVQIKGQDVRVLSHPDSFMAAFSSLAECYRQRGESVEYGPMPKQHATIVMHRISELPGIKPVNLLTRTPVFIRSGRLIQDGYDAKTGIYSTCQPIKPADDIKTLTRLLNPFCFADDNGASRANAIAILLTCLLTPWFIGQMAIWLIVGNKVGIGKTILAQIAAAIRTGEYSPTMTYSADDAELEKQICGNILRGREFLIIDNAKCDRRTGLISSPVIERTATDPVAQFRILGGSKMLSVENSLQFAITANSPDVSPDILDRSAITRLHYEGNTRARNFDIDDPVAFTLENRQQLLAELAGMIQRWIDGGMVEASTRGRRNEWPRILGGILETNGIEGLLANAETETAEMDDERQEFAQLVEAMANHPEAQRRRPGEIAVLAESYDLYRRQFFEKTDRSKSTMIGKLLTRYAGEKFKIADGKIATLISERDGNGNLYRVGVEGQTEEPQSMF